MTKEELLVELRSDRDRMPRKFIDAAIELIEQQAKKKDELIADNLKLMEGMKALAFQNQSQAMEIEAIEKLRRVLEKQLDDSVGEIKTLRTENDRLAKALEAIANAGEYPPITICDVVVIKRTAQQALLCERKAKTEVKPHSSTDATPATSETSRSSQ